MQDARVEEHLSNRNSLRGEFLSFFGGQLCHQPVFFLGRQKFSLRGKTGKQEVSQEAAKNRRNPL